nr:lonely Cys domain-containing protein [Streptomyces sp. NRRL F-6676]
MDTDTPSPQPQPPAQDPYLGPLVQAFGADITSHPQYARLREAMSRLDTLRRNDPSGSLRDGPFDLDAVTRRVMVFLPPETPIDRGWYGNLMQFALHPAMERATGLATLAAFGLSLRGALSDPNAMTAPDGTAYGRNWADRPGRGHRLAMDLDNVWEPTESAYGEPGLADPRPAPWRPAPGRPRPFVVVANGDHERVVVSLGDGKDIDVPMDVFVELLAMDPVLARLPKDVPVLLTIPGAGARQLELPRAAADRLARHVWSSSGVPRRQFSDDGASVRLFLEQQRGVPRGDWIRSEPGEVLSRADLQATLSTQVTATTQSSDVPEWERNLVSFTLVADGDGTRQIGRAAR